MSKCKSCGADVAINAKKCPHCGARILHWGMGLVVLLCGLFIFVFTRFYPNIPRGDHAPIPTANQHENSSSPLGSISATPTPVPEEDVSIYGPGTYTVGKDIDAGIYDCLAVSGIGVLRGDVASHGEAGFVLTMGGSSVSVGGDSVSLEAAESYSNLELADGDVIYIELNLKVKFVPK